MNEYGKKHRLATNDRRGHVWNASNLLLCKLV